MKRTKRLVSVILIAAAVAGIGVNEIAPTKAYAHDKTITDFGFDNWPGINFSTRMVNQFNGYVYNIQTVLNGVGYYCGKPDGHYGDNTAKAVRRFQEDHGLYPRDGVVGQATWAMLKLHCS